MTIDEVLAKEEKQILDRKSIHIIPADLSDTLCASMIRSISRSGGSSQMK